VDAVFYTVIPHRRSGDLDNLAKPVLDTLFHGSHVQETDDSLAGALFDAATAKWWLCTFGKSRSPLTGRKALT
jgi:hypothetical protein